MNMSRSTSCLPFRASNRPLAPRCPPMQHRRMAVCAAAHDEGRQQSWWPSLKSVALSIVGTAILLSPTTAFAVETVPPTQMMQYAKSLPKQQVNKGQIWAVFIGGAAALFLGTLALENNPAFFPAISKANKASAAAKQAFEAEDKEISLEEAEAAEVAEVLRQTAIVEQGLAEAKQRVLSQPPASRAQEPEAREPAASASRSEEAAEAGAPADSTADAAESQEAAKHARLASFVNSMAADGKQTLGSIKEPNRKEKDPVNSL